MFAANPSWRTSASLEEYPILKMAYRVYRARGGVSSARMFVGEAICCAHCVCIGMIDGREAEKLGVP